MLVVLLLNIAALCFIAVINMNKFTCEKALS